MTVCAMCPSFRPDDPDRIRLAGSRALLGSRFLFHTQLGVDYAVTPRLAVGVYYEHFSNGQILGQGRNQGLDEIGARLSWRFGPLAASAYSNHSAPSVGP